MENNFNNIDQQLHSKLSGFESSFSAEEMQADWSAVSGQIGVAGNTAQTGNAAGSAVKSGIIKTLSVAIVGALTMWGIIELSATNVPAVNAETFVEIAPNEIAQTTSNNQVAASEVVETAPMVSASTNNKEVSEKPAQQNIAASMPSSNEDKLDAETRNSDIITPPNVDRASNSETETAGSSYTEYADFIFDNNITLMNAKLLEYCQGSMVNISRMAGRGDYQARVKAPNSSQFYSLGRITSNTDLKLPLKQAGTYQLQFRTKTNTGWKTVEERTVAIKSLAKPVARFEVSNNIPNLYKFNNQSRNATTYEWRIGSEGSTETSPLKSFTKPGAYQATLIVSNDMCYDTLTKSIIVTQPVYVANRIGAPRAYVPGVGSERLYRLNQEDIATLGELSSFQVEIRHLVTNQKVFESFDADFGWNGTDLQGNACNTGEYFYILKYTVKGFESQAHTDYGLINLFR